MENMEHGTGLKLNVGGQQAIGGFPKGWLCVDILPGADRYCDISMAPLPFDDGVVDDIYCSHVLEHIWPWRLSFTVGQFHRVMRLNARIRIVVPDMDIAINQYVATRDDGAPGRLAGCMGWWFDPRENKDGLVHLSHVGGFNWYSMRDLLVRSGFRDVHRCKYGDCHPDFEGCDNPGHEGTSLYVEAVK